ncbi:MAG: lysophospholipid acyltransferase family protein [Pseudobdellovibrionaceae bacterium]
MKDWDYDNDQWTKLPGYLKHLPLFTRHVDLFSIFIRTLWGFFLKLVFFRTYIQLRVKGDFHKVYRENPRVLVISNHGSHLDAISIATAIPLAYWRDVYIAAAKDYFFTNFIFTFFSQHCLGAIPIDRKDRKGEAINLIMTLLNNLPRIWLILFPEGTRSKDGKVHDFKRGVSIFAERSNTPILFLFLEGNTRLWPKGAVFAKPGRLTIHVGPVHPPAPIETIYKAYRQWAIGIAPEAFELAENPEWKEDQNSPLSEQV